MKVALALLVLTVAVFARCPTFPTQNITIPRMLGDWYQIAATPWSRRTFERNCVCNIAKYGAGEGVVKLDQSCRDTKPDGKLSRYFGTARPTNPNDTGKLEVKFDGQPGTGTLWVVDTDYDNYYVSYSCQTILGITFENMWVAARKNYMEANTFRVLAEKAKKITGFDTSQYILTSHANCTYPTK